MDAAQQSRALPTAPGVAGLLPGGALRAGATYAVSGSTSLVAALMAGPSGDGAWCGVVGLPAFGAEAAAGLGVDLDRLVLVPRPAREWLNVVAALVDALTVVVVRPPGRVSPAEASRLSARMRKRGSIVVATGTYAQAWPGAEARLRVEQHSWSGLGEGSGYLTGRQATVAVTGRGTAVRPRHHRLWLPGPGGIVEPVTPATQPTRLPSRPDSLPALADVPDHPAWQEEAVG